MQTSSISPITIQLKKTSFILCLLVICICSLVLVEYLLHHSSIFKPLLKKGITMNPMVAILLILLSIATLLSINENIKYKKLINAIAGFVIFSAALKGFFLLFKIPVYPDRLLFSDQLYYEGVGYSSFPPSSIICLIFFSICLIFLDLEIGKNKNIRPIQYLCFISIFLVLVQLYAWIYEILIILVSIQMAVNTAICIFFLALAILFARPDKGTTQNLVGSYSTENTILRILALIVPLVIGWLRIKGEDLDYFSKEMGTAIFAIASFMISLILLSRNAVLQDNSRKAKENAAEKITANRDRLMLVLENISEGAGVANVKGEFIFYNKVSENLFGKEAWYVPKKLSDDDYSYYYPDGTTKIKPSKLPIFRAIIGETVDDMRLMIKNKEYPEGIMLKVKSMPLKNKEGKIEEGITIFRDISYRANISNLFQNEEKRSKAIIKNLDVAIVIADLKEDSSYFNAKAKKLLGKEINTKINKVNWAEYFGIYDSNKKLFSIEDLPFFKADAASTGDFYVNNNELKEPVHVKYKTLLIVDDYGELFSIATLMEEISSNKT